MRKFTRLRGDMAICFALTILCVIGISKLDEKTGFFERGFDAVEEALSTDSSKVVPDGEIGGFATEDTLRINPEEDALRNTNGAFTMEVNYVDVINRGTVTGNEYEWHMMELENGKLVAIRINFDKIQDVQKGNFNNAVLPVGVCVYSEDCEAYHLIRQRWNDCEVIDDFYIDMDGEAGYSKTIPQGIVMGILVAIHILIPILIFGLLLGLTLLFHRIGYRLGIFPPLFK